jgi:hypothetical protein
LYVLNSKDEDSDVEFEVDGMEVATEGASTANGPVDQDLFEEGPLVVDVDGVVVQDLPRKGPPPVAEAEASSMDLPPEGHPLVAGVGAIGEELPPQVDEASEMDLAPEVAARLKQVLANIDPIYHGVFVSMYKVLVPIFFRP